jgi:SNF family Na+-dependent transporter
VLNIQRGLFRAWVLISVLWIAAFGALAWLFVPEPSQLTRFGNILAASGQDSTTLAELARIAARTNSSTSPGSSAW